MNKTDENYRIVTGARPRKSRAMYPKTISPAGKPSAPKWLSADALAEWRRIVPLLARRGTLTRVDSMTIAIYCETVARYQQALHSVQSDGLNIQVSVLDSNGVAHTSTKPNPSLKVLESCERTIHRFSREFGGTPRSRELTRPAQQPDKPKEKKFDLLAAMKAEKRKNASR